MASQQQQVSQLQAGSQSMIALLLAATPLYLFSVQARSRLGLDNLHLGLLQVVLLLLMGHLSSFLPTGLFSKRSKSRIKAPVAVASASPAPEASKSKPAVRAPTPKRRQRPPPSQPAKIKAKMDDRFPASLLDGVVGRFLSCTSPEHLNLLPSSASSDPPADATPLSSWKSLHETEDLQVMQHPSTSTLYAICARFPKVPLRNLYEVLTTIERRKEWDGMCSGSKTVQEVDVEFPTVGGDEKSEGVTGKIRRVKGNVVWIGMKGVALIKAKDMVLLSIAGCLPRSSPEEPLRIVCATTSTTHPEVPPRSDYNRMELGVSGFLIEEDGSGGSKIVQVTDLSGLGSWVPNAVIRTVTQTMLPKSLTKLGQAAADTDLAKESKYPLEGDDWMPPVLGEAVEPSAPSPVASASADYNREIDEEDSGSSTLADSDSDVGKGIGSASSSRELHSLINQLRTVTARLNALENPSPSSAGARSWLPKVLGGGVEQGQLEAFGGSKVVALTALGGAAGAAVVLAALKGWERRRR